MRRFGERAALDGVDLHLAGGEFVLVTGPNGAGKTTLLRVLATVHPAERGRASRSPATSSRGRRRRPGR